jgi:hypothetical protein
MMQSTSDHATAPRRVALVWSGAVTVASFSTWVLFGARPGINLFLCLLAVLLLAQVLDPRPPGPGRHESLLIEATALLLAGALAVCAGGPATALAALAVVWLCALSVLQRAGRLFPRQGVPRWVAAPFAALAIVLSRSTGLLGDAARAFRGGRYVSALRGAAWAMPTVLVFFLFLANADPTFEGWRSEALDTLRNLSFLPRLLFWLILAVVMLGGLSLSAHPQPVERAQVSEPRRRAHRTVTERSIALGAVALLFALFLVLQVKVLFGDPGGRAGSGMTYAEAVHRGFAELTGVVTLTALMILVLDAAALREQHEGRVRALSGVLLAQCLLLLASAWLRLLAYEEAYGYSMLRVYVHLYILWVAAGLLLLAREVLTRMDPQRVLRGAVVAGLVGLVGVSYFNLPAWVVERNVARYQQGGVLDRSYLVQGGGLDALPTIERLLPGLRADDRAAIRCLILQRHAGERDVLRAPEHWFEWNLRRHAARAALARLTASTAGCAARQGED